MKRRTAVMMTMVALAGIGAGAALGCGGPPPTPLYVERRGGTAAELGRLYGGRLGLVMARSPAPLLYLDWRLLHGLRVGEAAGAMLTTPCCDTPSAAQPEAARGVAAWADARALVPDAPALPSWLPTERQGPDYTTIPNCFDDAFDTAAATLRDRAARYGRTAPAVRAWLLAQDAVFNACGNADAALPPTMPDAPAWLAADRAYQEAAFALYNFRTAEAATRFAAIAHDHASPWRPMGLYLGARAYQREALAHPTPESFAQARASIASLASAPAGTYGQGEARKMLRALAYRDRPAALLAELDHELNRPEPADDIALGLSDYLSLGARATARPDAVDWIQTLQAAPGNRVQALAHARERWSASRDPAWLVAALSLANPEDEAAAGLAADAGRIEPDRPAWTSAQYHLIRLTMASADPAATRARLDAILAEPTLSLTERNLFTAERLQVATDLADLARFAVRRPYCIALDGSCEAEDFAADEGTLGRVGGTGPWLGLGADARAIIDRLPLADRIALSRNPGLPEALRLDIALTGFARAVQLQDDRTIDMLAANLVGHLPQLAEEWRTIARTAPGPARRFAEYFAMAKLPGLRPYLVGYVRPQGTVPQFQGQWVDWQILPRGAPARPAETPSPGDYMFDLEWSGADASENDLTCLGACGRGSFPAHLPPFVAALQPRADAERAAFVTGTSDRAGNPRILPPGTLAVWDEALAYAQVHPRDPRAPETLYWLIHVARWGGNRNHLGRRAFRLLHDHYPNSSWARQSPYYYDG
jgi:hypothetical protein